MWTRLRGVLRRQSFPAWLLIVWQAADYWSRVGVIGNAMVGIFHFLARVGHTNLPLVLALLWFTGVILWPELKRFGTKPPPRPSGGRISMVICGQAKKYNLGTPGNGQYEFKIGGRPRKLFFEAGMLIVTEDDLQKDIRTPGGKFRIKRFTDEGFVVDDFGVPVGFEVWMLDWIPKP
jgi:hypothetical protein